MRVVPLGLAALLWTGAALAQTALAQTNTPHTDPGRSGIGNAPVGAQAAPGATPGIWEPIDARPLVTPSVWPVAKPES